MREKGEERGDGLSLTSKERLSYARQEYWEASIPEEYNYFHALGVSSPITPSKSYSHARLHAYWHSGLHAYWRSGLHARE
jgi:hypothetical protein